MRETNPKRNRFQNEARVHDKSVRENEARQSLPVAQGCHVSRTYSQAHRTDQRAISTKHRLGRRGRDSGRAEPEDVAGELLLL